MSVEKVNGALKSLGEKIGIPDLSFDENGYCCLMFDDIVVNLELHKETESLFIYSNIGDLSEKKSEEFYEMLLEANFLFKDTDGAAIGVDTETGIISLCYRMPAGTINDESLETAVENFLHLTERWKEKIREFQLPEDTNGQSPNNFTLKV